MSWMHRGQATPPAPEPDPAGSQRQPYINHQNMYPNYQDNATSAAQHLQQQQQYWQMQQQPMQYNQQYGQVYQHQQQPQQPQEFAANNANQMYPQYNQNYSNPTYNTTQPNYPAQQQQQNYYPNQPTQQNFTQGKKKDGWEDNWDWGWEDPSKQMQNAANLQQSTTVPTQQPAFNNANVIEESFASTNKWNWSTEDKNQTNLGHTNVAPPQDKRPPVPSTETHALETASSEHPKRNASNMSAQSAADEVRTLNDKEIVKERLPNLALGKRLHLENLTPQWSIESQMSQESSDGIQTHSESTYLSENQSRNSNSSPVLNADHYNSHSLEESPQNTEWSKHSVDESTISDNTMRNMLPEDHTEVINSLRDMSIANRENPRRDSVLSRESALSRDSGLSNHDDVVQENGIPLMIQPSFPQLPPFLPPPQMSSVMPPPPQASNSSSGTNPFKNAGGFSHKITSVLPPTSQYPPVPKEMPSQPSTNLTSPAAVNMVQHGHSPMGFCANLETTPDNSERPDQPQVSTFRPVPSPQQVPDNLEVAPRNDRNEYLQTAHLSSGDYGENTDFSRSAPPPPGLRRMVVGQQESEYNQNMSGDEPPPGLSRMVPGQQTESDGYNQGDSYSQGDSYMDRHADGGPTDGGGRPYRQADGQQTPDNFNQAPNRGSFRMVPGESNGEFAQYQPSSFGNEQRVVTGLDFDYGAAPTDVREQNVDGSDYTEPPPPLPRAARSPGVGNRDSAAAQREVTVDGENLQDLSAVSSAELSFPRDLTAELDTTDAGADRRPDLSDAEPPPPGPAHSRRHSVTRMHTSGEDSERDRLFKSSSRRDRDKHKSTRDRDARQPRDRDDKKMSRDSERRRSDKDRKERDRDDRRERDGSPDERRSSKRSARRRYDTEDTDYYSDKERERRSYRESSYTSKPPRPSDKDKRYRDERERDKTRRYHTIERDGRYESRRERGERVERGERGERRPRYRDIDPAARHAPRDKREYSPPRPHSRDATDDDTDRRERRARHARPDAYSYDPYAAESYSDPYALQRRQYQYYEQLRRSDPAAYMQLYTRLMAGEAPPLPPGWEGYGSLGYDSRPDERVSVNSGRSSANGLTGKDMYYGSLRGLRRGGDSPRNAPSLRTDLSDRDFNTDASLNLHLDESTVRSERMTPFKFSTAHVKADISSGHVVVVRPSYPVDGAPATVHVLSLQAALQHDPVCQELQAYPGPLARGVTHKKSVVEYCLGRAAGAARCGGDVIGRALVWQFLAMMLTQNGMVVGSDIAELLMKNIRDYELMPAGRPAKHNGSRRGSSSVSESRSRGSRSRDMSPQPPPPNDDAIAVEELGSQPQPPDPRTALDRYRELLIFGDKQQALEWAMSNNLWGHALYLSTYCERRSRAAAAARFLSHLAASDPLHTLYAAAASQHARALACVSEGAEWRSHAAILLANGTGRPEEDQMTLVKIGDALGARGFTQSAQFVYLAAGLPPARHPLSPLPPAAAAATAPPRLSLLLAEPRVTELRRFATNEAIFATEVYEYAMSLNVPDFVVPELQVYKLVLATRLLDCGLHARALAYTERVARALTRDPASYSPALLTQVAELADRLKYHEPLLAEDPPLVEDGDSAPASPRHQWIDDVRHAARLTAQAESQHSTPQHTYYQQEQHEQPQQQQLLQQQMPQQQAQQQYSWTQEQQLPQHLQPGYAAAATPPPAPAPALAAPDHDYSYYQQDNTYQTQQEPPHYQPQQDGYVQEAAAGYAGEWGAPHAGDAWPDQRGGYHEGGGAAAPQITMPGAAPPASKPSLYTDFEDERPAAAESEQPASTQAHPSKKEESKQRDDGKSAKTGWLGGILTKLSLRAPNQMILPDDKNPSIVWDPERKRWRNTDGTEDEEVHAPPPPPRDPQHPSAAPVMTPTAGVPPPLQAPLSNMYKLQKSRHIKKSYVDVFNPSGAPPSRAPPAAADVLPPAPPAAPLSYFVPGAPSHDTGRYLDPVPSNEESNWG